MPSYVSHSQASKGTKKTEQIALAESCSCFSGDQDTFKAPPTIKCHLIAKNGHNHASDKQDWKKSRKEFLREKIHE